VTDACPSTLVARYAEYDAAFSTRNARRLQSIETSNFKDTDPDGTQRTLTEATENQSRFFAMAHRLHLQSSVRCRERSGNQISTVARMSLTGSYTPSKSHEHRFSQVYINHDLWQHIAGTWRLVSQTTVRLDGVDNGKPVHIKLR